MLTAVQTELATIGYTVQTGRQTNLDVDIVASRVGYIVLASVVLSPHRLGESLGRLGSSAATVYQKLLSAGWMGEVQLLALLLFEPDQKGVSALEEFRHDLRYGRRMVVVIAAREVTPQESIREALQAKLVSLVSPEDLWLPPLEKCLARAPDDQKEYVIEFRNGGKTALERLINRRIRAALEP